MPRTMSANHHVQRLADVGRWHDVGRGLITIDIAKPTRLALLRMMQPARPIDRNIALPPIQPRRPLHTAPRTNPTKLKQPIENRTIIAHIILALLLGKAVHIIRRHALQEVDVLVSVELGHLVLGGGFGAVDFEVFVEAVVHDEGVGHADAVGLHGVAGVVGVVADVGVVEVGDFFGLR